MNPVDYRNTDRSLWTEEINECQPMISEYGTGIIDMNMKLYTDMNKNTVDEVNCKEQKHSELEPMSQLFNQKRGFQEIDDDNCEMIAEPRF